MYAVRVTDDDTQGPMIGAPSYANSVPSDEPITVTVEVSDQTTGGHGVLTATLHFGYTVPYNQHSIGGSGPGGDGDGIWTFIILAQGDAYEGQTLRFSLEACDGDNSPVCSMRDNSGNYYAVRIASSFEIYLPLVVRNS